MTESSRIFCSRAYIAHYYKDKFKLSYSLDLRISVPGKNNFLLFVSVNFLNVADIKIMVAGFDIFFQFLIVFEFWLYAFATHFHSPFIFKSKR